VANGDDLQGPVYHLALAQEWREAVERRQSYGRSTLGKSQAEVGFIHCSFARQVDTIARLIYRGVGMCCCWSSTPLWSTRRSELKISKVEATNSRTSTANSQSTPWFEYRRSR
jgi:hypothetical protein